MIVRSSRPDRVRPLTVTYYMSQNESLKLRIFASVRRDRPSFVCTCGSTGDCCRCLDAKACMTVVRERRLRCCYAEVQPRLRSASLISLRCKASKHFSSRPSRSSILLSSSLPAFLLLYVQQVSRREAMYFRQRGVEESDLKFQDPVKYK